MARCRRPWCRRTHGASRTAALPVTRLADTASTAGWAPAVPVRPDRPVSQGQADLPPVPGSVIAAPEAGGTLADPGVPLPSGRPHVARQGDAVARWCRPAPGTRRADTVLRPGQVVAEPGAYVPKLQTLPSASRAM